MLYLCRVKPLRHYLRGFLIAAWAGDKIAEFSFPEISFHFPLRPWFFFVSPAYAGKSPARFSSPRRCRDHPRVCGEKAFVQFPLFVSDKLRITPACAGKRQGQVVPGFAFEDHPRVCGEKSKTKDTAAYTPGSPPHVRGKVSTRFCAISCHGITPACAGKRCLHRFCKGISKDHPRVCGEKSRCWLDLEPPTGSPPRMRGKGLGASKGCDGVGITPACAGKSASHGCGSRGWRDHPRVCGEKVSAIHRESASLGSPPRMRGKVTSGMLFLAFIGITPAYAGKRQMARKAGRTKPDHPRVCGEKTKKIP